MQLCQDLSSQTFWDFGHRARLNPEGGFPLLGGPSPAVLLKLGAAELPVSLRLPGAVLAQADDALQAQQEDAAKAIAEHNDLQHSPTWPVLVNIQSRP